MLLFSIVQQSPTNGQIGRRKKEKAIDGEANIEEGTKLLEKNKGNHFYTLFLFKKIHTTLRKRGQKRFLFCFVVLFNFSCFHNSIIQTIVLWFPQPKATSTCVHRFFVLTLGSSRQFGLHRGPAGFCFQNSDFQDTTNFL